MKSEKVNEKNNKTETDFEFREQTSGYQRGGSVDEEQDRGRKLRGSDYVLSV